MRLYPINAAFVVFGTPVANATELNAQLETLDYYIDLVTQEEAKLTILLSGSFADMALTEGHQTKFLDLIALGHEVGTLVPAQCRTAQNVWKNVIVPTFPSKTPRDDGMLFRIWSENTASVNSLIGAPNNKTVHSLHFITALEETLVTNNGFDGTFGNRNARALLYLGHQVEHPFRPAISPTDGYELKEFTRTQFVYVDGYLNVQDQEAATTCPDLRDIHISRYFSNIYKKWNALEDNRVWSFGFAVALDRPELKDEVKAIFSTLDDYVGKRTPALELIARYSTVKAIRTEFYSWEAANPPDTSSFSYVQTPKDLTLPESHVAVNESAFYVQSLNFRKIFTHMHKPATALSNAKKPGVVLLSGDGSIVPGFSPHELAQLGFVVMHYDRAGKGQSSGTNDYGGLNDQDDLKIIVQYLKNQDFVNEDNVGIISLGFGLSIAAGTLNRYPDLNVSYLVDWEGPSNRYNIQEDQTENFMQFDLNDDDFWEPREPFQTIKSFAGRYLRIQAAIDHFRGTDMSHAVEMMNSATNFSYGGEGSSDFSVLNGNAPNRTYDVSAGDSTIAPQYWLKGSSVVNITKDNAANIAQFFKNIAHYARLNITVNVIVPGLLEFQQQESSFRTIAQRLRKLVSAFERANAKLSVLTENAFVEGTRFFSDNVLAEIVQRGHTVGSLISIPLSSTSDQSKKKYIVDTRSNISQQIGTINNKIVMGALSLDDPGFLADIGYKAIVGPLLNIPHNIPRSAVVRKLGLNSKRSDQTFLTIDDPYGKLFYLPGDLSKLAQPGGISTTNTQRATNSIVISRNLLNANRTNSWYIYLDITEFSNEDSEIAILEQWATQDVGEFVLAGEVIWKNLNDIVDESQSLNDRDSLFTPLAPTDLRAESDDHLVKLSWLPSASNNVKGYIILRDSSCFGREYVPIGTTLQPGLSSCSADDGRITFCDGKAENGIEYCYKVKAFTDDNPPIFSETTDEVCATARDLRPPPVPKFIDVIAGNRTVGLYWNPASTADTQLFRLYRHKVDQDNRIDLSTITDACDLRENFELVAELAPNVHNFVDTGLDNNQEYIYIISAVDDSGNEAFDTAFAVSVIPHENLATIPLWVATRLGVSRTVDKGETFTTFNPCGAQAEGSSDITFQVPTDRSFVSDPVRVVLAVDDPKGIQKVELAIGDEKNRIICDNTLGNLFECALDASQFADGTAVPIFAIVTNSVGTITRESITVQIRDIVGPVITVINPITGDTVTTSLTVQIMAQDPSGIDQVSVSLDGGATFQCAKKVGAFWQIDIDTRTLNGPLSIIASATDLAGRQTIAPPVVVNVDNLRDTTGPQITVLSPLNGGEIAGEIDITAAAADPSGVTNMEVSFNGGQFFPMSFSDLNRNEFMMTNAKYINWSPDGSRIVFINSVDNRLYQVLIDSTGRPGPATLLWNIAAVPVIDIENFIENFSFEAIDTMGDPEAWEINANPATAYIVVDADVQNVLVGPSRRLSVDVPQKLLLAPGSFVSEGSPANPINAGGEFGLFVWHEPVGSANVWHVAATSNGTARVIEGAIISNYDIVNFNDTGLLASDATAGTRDIRFTFNVNSTIEEFTFETPDVNPTVRRFGQVTTLASDGVSAVRLTR